MQRLLKRRPRALALVAFFVFSVVALGASCYRLSTAVTRLQPHPQTSSGTAWNSRVFADPVTAAVPIPITPAAPLITAAPSAITRHDQRRLNHQHRFQYSDDEALALLRGAWSNGSAMRAASTQHPNVRSSGAHATGGPQQDIRTDRPYVAALSEMLQERGAALGRGRLAVTALVAVPQTGSQTHNSSTSSLPAPPREQPMSPAFWAMLDGLAVMRESMTQYFLTLPDVPDSVCTASFIALATRDVSDAAVTFLAAAGWAVVRADFPVPLHEIQNRAYAREVAINGAVGAAELLKFEPLQWGAAFREVVVLDADLMFLPGAAALDPEFLAEFVDALRGRQGVKDRNRGAALADKAQSARQKNEKHVSASVVALSRQGGAALHVAAQSESHQIAAATPLTAFDVRHATLGQRDRNRVLYWTGGASINEFMNGGFFSYRPQGARGLRMFREIAALIREGAFDPRTGWHGTDFGRTWGGATIQGLLPYYFLHYRRNASNSGALVPPKRGNAKKNVRETVHDHLRTADVRFDQQQVDRPDHQEIDGCFYNNMNRLARCIRTPCSTIRSVHFSGSCSKPWACASSAEREVYEWTRPQLEAFLRKVENVTRSAIPLTQIIDAKASAHERQTRCSDWAVTWHALRRHLGWARFGVALTSCDAALSSVTG